MNMSGSRTTSSVLGSTKSREDKPQAIVYFHSEKVIYGGKSYNDGVFYLHFKVEIMPVVLRLLRSG
ncbi:MAG TPA: hypothetical protein VEV84_10385 [Pyrinomonadaceae bacterium]|nr:hypothetical protein [Pyrinomonadaceae bacterium]